MTVKAIVFDVSETLVHEDQPVPGVTDMLALCSQLGLRVVATMGDPRRKMDRALSIAGLTQHFDMSISRDDVAGGKAKGSPAWVDALKQRTGLTVREMAYVGDSKRDMITALRGPIPYFHAGWSPTAWNKYGIYVPTVRAMRLLIEHVILKDWLWSWTGTSADGRNRRTTHRALVIAGDQLGDIYGPLVQYLKDGIDSDVGGGVNLSLLVTTHLVTSLFNDDLLGAGLITAMPGHVGGVNAVLAPTCNLLAYLSKATYVPDLIRRHTPAQNSRKPRKESGDSAALRNQFTTLDIPATDFIRGKSVLVLDDFLTSGATLEAARVLLHDAGAAAVTLVTVGKFPGSVYVTDLLAAGDQDYDSATINRSPYAARTESDAKFIRSYRMIQKG